MSQDRREFIKKIAAGGFYLFLPHLFFSCKKRDSEEHLKESKYPPPVPRRFDITLKSEDRKSPDFPVRWDHPFHPVDGLKWILTVDGLVQKIGRFTLGDIEMFPSRRITCRLKSVEGWSIKKSWTGIHFRDLCNYVKPKPEATYVHFICADDYFECIELTDLLGPRVILAYRLEDEFIPLEHGYPLRLIIPHKYSYKSAKAIVRIVFSDEKKLGTKTISNPELFPWAGDIKPGIDHPIELNETKEISGGEITSY